MVGKGLTTHCCEDEDRGADKKSEDEGIGAGGCKQFEQRHTAMLRALPKAGNTTVDIARKCWRSGHGAPIPDSPSALITQPTLEEF